MIYDILLEIVWWTLSNATLIVGILSDTVYTKNKSLWSWLRDVWTYRMILASAYMLYHLSAI